MPIVGVLTVYLGAYLLLLFASVCLATGLYYLAEAVEESPRLARWVLQRGVAAELALHGVLLLLDGQPLRCCAVGAVAHLVYLRLLQQHRFPLIPLLSADFLAAAFAFCCAAWMWGQHLYRETSLSLEAAAGFLTATTLAVPFGLAVSLSSAAEAPLPTTTGAAWAADPPAAVQRHGGAARPHNVLGTAIAAGAERLRGVRATLLPTSLDSKQRPD